MYPLLTASPRGQRPVLAAGGGTETNETNLREPEVWTKEDEEETEARREGTGVGGARQALGVQAEGSALREGKMGRGLLGT